MELHNHSHSRSTCRDDNLFTIVMMIPQWSLSGVIQLGTHFSALRCHRAPLSKICILAWWEWCCYRFGWPGLHICWCMIRRHLIFPICHAFDAIRGHISVLDRDLQILTFAWSPSITSYSWVIRTDQIHLMPYWGLWIWRWSFSHRSVTAFITRSRDIVFASRVTVLAIFIEMSFHCSRMFELWLPHYSWFFSRLLYWDHVGYPIRSFL